MNLQDETTLDPVKVESNEKRTFESQALMSHETGFQGISSAQDEDDGVDEQIYGALVIDSGPIIRLTGLSALRGRAKRYFTVPNVLQEIRDAKARDHLDQLPFDLVAREASAEGIHAVAQFARQTGDYHSLSAVDLQVLGLVYDLEREGCQGRMDHIRTKPKRKIGLGKVEFLNGKTSPTEAKIQKEEQIVATEKTGHSAEPTDEPHPENQKPQSSNAPKSWAMIVNPEIATAPPPVTPLSAQSFNYSSPNEELKEVTKQAETIDLGGQFSDADDSESQEGEESSDDDNDGYADPDKEVSDEECDVYVFNPDEVETRYRNMEDLESSVKQELMSDFPSLAASLHVSYEGEDADHELHHATFRPLTEAELEQRKREALKPISKSGKLYNSFPKYRDLLKSNNGATLTTLDRLEECASREAETAEAEIVSNIFPDENEEIKITSRIIGGAVTSGQEIDVEDDGEGWITCSKDIQKMSAKGGIVPCRTPKEPSNKNTTSSGVSGPPIRNRAACATTDFAMQNVILQMNLELLSVDGVKIRRLKSWVLRCGACFAVHADGEMAGPLGTKRLFCSRCGSDMMQRISASVDGKSGRLKLHLSQRRKNNLRGTKFSLPKPGTGNRFQGDLLLREDQLLTGAWNQKVKMMTGGQARRAAQSMFGSDLASTVGCNASSVKGDVKVGFGRRNPNAAKGRERRGKKEKSSDKACGLRRY